MFLIPVFALWFVIILVSEYTYEEVEVEIFETDDEGDAASESSRLPDTIQVCLLTKKYKTQKVVSGTKNIKEPPITETDDQIASCVLESDINSGIQNYEFASSIPASMSEESFDVSQTTNSIMITTDQDYGQSSTADMADDEAKKSTSRKPF